MFFSGHNRTFSGTGFPPVRKRRLGAEISCSRSFPLISERCLHSGGGRLFVGGPVLGRVPAGAGVAVGYGNFLFPAHFRSFPSVASGQAGAGCPLGPGTEVGLKPAPTHLASRGNDRNYCSHAYDENTAAGGASSRGGSDGGGVPNHGFECENTGQFVVGAGLKPLIVGARHLNWNGIASEGSVLD